MRISAYIFIVLVSFLVFLALPGAKAMQSGQAVDASEIISDVTFQEMVDLLKGFGWAAKVWENDEEPPEFVQIKFNEYTSWLTFKDCIEGIQPRCATLLFFANFDLGRRISSNDPEVLNKYNDTKVIGRAYFLKKPEEDQDQIGIDFRISLEGGVTREHLRLEAGKWEGAINDFVANFREE